MATRQQQLNSLAETIIERNITPELSQQATQLVMGSGDVFADIVFIGEAPGKAEDEKGVPFIGASGKFLDHMLAEAGMRRNEVYITNIVKYRPPKNRDPSPTEKAAFLPYLLAQLEIIQPKIIITLGRHSMEYFLPKEKIGEIHGQPQHILLGGKEVMLIPLFHPAAALYNGSLRQTLVDDFRKVPEIIKKNG